MTNEFTETIIREARAVLGDDFWGFLMLGGMAGGGMAFFVAPERHDEFQDQIAAIMHRAKSGLDDALPFAMEPVVYDFRINPHGTFATLDTGPGAMMPPAYYELQVPRMLAIPAATLSQQRRADVDHFASTYPEDRELLKLFRKMVNHLFPVTRSAADTSAADWDEEAERIRLANGFDAVQHEQLRDDLQRGRIGLARNRLPVNLDVRDVEDSELIPAYGSWPSQAIQRGESVLARGEAAIVTLAAGVGSRWTTGAGVVKAVNPFVQLAGAHRSFLEIHLAKTGKLQRTLGIAIPHVVTTSYLTHSAIEHHLHATGNYGHDGPVYLSRGQSIGQRLIPMTRDLTFLWEETSHETLDENKQKVREAGRRAILEWARSQREGSDYTDNVPIQRFNPPGHFYEVPNLLRNGVLARLLDQHPRLNWLLVHNIDTLGVTLDPGVLSAVIDSGSTAQLRSDPQADRRPRRRPGQGRRPAPAARGTGAAARGHRVQAALLQHAHDLGADRWPARCLRADSRRPPARPGSRSPTAVRSMAARVPTYVTIKDVKRRWGHGQEDVYPVAQFEKLWGDLSSLPDLSCSFLAVDRRRGQQLKDAAQLDGWANDGSMEHVQSLCEFTR